MIRVQCRKEQRKEGTTLRPEQGRQGKHEDSECVTCEGLRCHMSERIMAFFSSPMLLPTDLEISPRNSESADLVADFSDASIGARQVQDGHLMQVS